jgi:hypothetical protein
MIYNSLKCILYHVLVVFRMQHGYTADEIDKMDLFQFVNSFFERDGVRFALSRGLLKGHVRCPHCRNSDRVALAVEIVDKAKHYYWLLPETQWDNLHESETNKLVTDFFLCEAFKATRGEASLDCKDGRHNLWRLIRIAKVRVPEKSGD